MLIRKHELVIISGLATNQVTYFIFVPYIVSTSQFSG